MNYKNRYLAIEVKKSKVEEYKENIDTQQLRHRKQKYDSSDYYLPSLKKKTRVITPDAKNVNQQKSKKDNNSELISTLRYNNLEDIRNWSNDEVVHYFMQCTDEETANILKEQDIDGYFMLLMSRNDVLSFGLKPKIFLIIKKLQEISNNHMCNWIEDNI